MEATRAAICDLNCLAHVVDEGEEERERQQPEPDRDGDAQAGHERIAGPLVAHPSEDEQAVDEDADEDAGDDLSEAVGQKAPERARRELARDQRQHDDRQRERQTGNRNQRAGDGRENVSSGPGVAVEAEGDASRSRRPVDREDSEREPGERGGDQPGEQPEPRQEVLAPRAKRPGHAWSISARRLARGGRRAQPAAGAGRVARWVPSREEALFEGWLETATERADPFMAWLGVVFALLVG